MHARHPLTLGPRDEPEPDIAVVRGVVDDYADVHPSGSDALLVIEISRATRKADLGIKALRYAVAGVEEYRAVGLVPVRHVGCSDEGYDQVESLPLGTVTAVTLPVAVAVG